MSLDCSCTFSKSKSSGASFLRNSMMKRTTPAPTSSTTSRRVTNVPARLDIFTGSPPRNSRTSWHTFTSRLALASAHRLDRRLQALHIARVIGAQHIDHVREAAGELVAVIGDVGSEIGQAAIGLEHRAVDVVAELGRAEKRLLARLPVFGRLAFRRLEHAAIKESLCFEERDGLLKLARTSALKRALRKEDVVLDAERREVVANERHHGVDGVVAHRRQAMRLPGLPTSALPWRSASALPTATRYSPG